MPSGIPHLVRFAAPLALVLCAAAAHAGESSHASAGPAANNAAVSALRFPAEIQPLLASYCTDCHGGDNPDEGLALDRYENLAQILDDRARWEKVLARVQFNLMPPTDMPQPTDGERQTLVHWIQRALDNLDCSAPVDPGRATLRRLNRYEYQRTVRDLFDVDFAPADEFPSDDVGYGFDNIADVLSVSPLLFEKYLSAAEQILGRVFVLADRTTVRKKKYEAERLEGTGSARPRRSYHGLYSAAEIFTNHDFPATGEYDFHLRASGDQAGPDPVRVSLRVAGHDDHHLDVTAERSKPGIYTVRLPVEVGTSRIGIAFINDYYRPNDPDPALKGDRNLYVDYLEIEGPFNPTPPEPDGAYATILYGGPDEPTVDFAALSDDERREHARRILARFAARAFRRPVTDEELSRLTAIYVSTSEAGESFEQSLAVALQAILVSPHFLFRIEAQPADAKPGEVYPLDDYAVATRLSYFLTSTTPDDELLAHAAAGELSDPAVLDREVDRLLADEKSYALVENFAVQWLQLRNLANLSPDPERFPDFDAALRAAMLHETEAFIASVLRDDRPLRDLLDSDYAVLNARLAGHYGLAVDPASFADDEFRRVALTGDDRLRRGGLLSQASILTITSNPTRTSPVKRGKWVLEVLFGTPPPPPPPNVPELPEEAAETATGTLRQRLEQHRANPSCAACHQLMDPLGFGLENYDAVGSWRDTDEGHTIDPAGELPTGESFAGPAQLKQVLLGKQDQFYRAFTEKLLTYALGRGLVYSDRCEVDKILAAAAERDYRFSDLAKAIIRSPLFLTRRATGDES